MKNMKVIFIIVAFLRIIGCGQTFYITKQNESIVRGYYPQSVENVKQKGRYFCQDEVNSFRLMSSLVFIGFLFPDYLFSNLTRCEYQESHEN